MNERILLTTNIITLLFVAYTVIVAAVQNVFSLDAYYALITLVLGITGIGASLLLRKKVS